MKIRTNHYKMTAELLLAIPIILLIVLGIGEILSGDWSGIQHLIELVPLAILAIISWFYPKLGGFAIAAGAALLAALYIISFNLFPFIYRVFANVIIFLPPFIAGLLFFTAGMEQEESERGYYDDNF